MPNQDNQGKRDKDRGSQGFQNMNPDRQKEIAPEGGRDAQEFTNRHQLTQEEAKKGGQNSHRGQQGGGTSSPGQQQSAQQPSGQRQQGEPAVHNDRNRSGQEKGRGIGDDKSR